MNYIIFLLLLLTSCQQNNDFQPVAELSLAKELMEVKADSGLLILLKDCKTVAKVNLVLEDSLYKESNGQVFQTKRDMGTLLSPAYLMAISDSVSLADTVDVGNGIYLKDGVQIEDHNADRGGYGVINAEQVITFDSKIGMVKLLERSGNRDEKISSLDFQNFQATPEKTLAYFNRIANEDISLYPAEKMKQIRYLLRKVITDGTGKNLDLENLEISGKTGKTNENEISCCAYFKMKGSVYTCLVIISNPKKGYPSGGMMCGEVIKRIVEEIKESNNGKGRENWNVALIVEGKLSPSISVHQNGLGKDSWGVLEI